jgi:hypothetical protein
MALFVRDAGGDELATPLVLPVAPLSAHAGTPVAGQEGDRSAGGGCTAVGAGAVVPREAADVAVLLNQAEVTDYIEQTGAWEPTAAPAAADAECSPASDGAISRGASEVRAAAGKQSSDGSSSGRGGQPASRRVTVDAGAASATAQLADSHQGQAIAAQLGRVVAGLAAAAAAAAPATAGGTGTTGRGSALPTLDHLLRLAVVGAPLSGKSTVAGALARQHGLKVLEPVALVAEALAAAQAWDADQQQTGPQGAAIIPIAEDEDLQQQGGSANIAAPCAPPAKVLLGRSLAVALAAGGSTPDALLVEAVVIGIEEARSCTAPQPECTPHSDMPSGGTTGRAKASSAGSKGTAGATLAQRGAGAPVSATAAGGWAAGAPPLAGGPGRGFVLDGFPATATQAAALERALTGLDLTAEAALVEGASRLAPPPPDALPQLARPLVSGLDAVVALEGVDEGAAVARALGRRLDRATGRCMHVERGRGRLPRLSSSAALACPYILLGMPVSSCMHH